MPKRKRLAVALPSKPVSAVCALTGCQHFSMSEREAELVRDVLRRAADLCERDVGKWNPASENADRYRDQDDLLKGAAMRILSLAASVKDDPKWGEQLTDIGAMPRIKP